MASTERLRKAIMHPARIAPLAFLAFQVLGTLALMLPISVREGHSPDIMAASFTTVSATCVTGLVNVDTATYWSTFGQVVILAEIQVGGFGIMTLATLLSLLVRGRLGLSSRLLAQAETKTLDVGDVRVVLLRIFKAVAIAEGVVAVVLTVRFYTTYDDANLRQAVWHGVFHSISAFNNAGFAVYSDNIVGFVSDAWICFPISLAIMAGGIGYPVFFELRRAWRRPASWSAHTKLTVYGYSALFVIGFVTFLVFEYNNAKTIGNLDGWGKTVASVTASATARTAGFNSIDYGFIEPETLITTVLLMFVGGGSAGTAGGLKVTTFFLLAAVILAEIKGQDDVRVGHRRIANETIRQALTIALLSVGLVVAGTVGMVMLTEVPLDKSLFEVVSAFGTVGLSTGITPTLPVPAQLLLMLIMYCGRIGTVSVATAIALNNRKPRYHLPEARPIVG